MSPKSLTGQEKQLQRQRLLEKGRELLFTYGVKKTSVEDITKAAGMAKGTFYQHFESKEVFFLELITQFHVTWFSQAEVFFAAPSEQPLEERVREFIRGCFHSHEYLSIFKYHDELEEMLLGMQAGGHAAFGDLMDMEHAAYERLLHMFRIDTQRVKPGVIHNYLHAVYFGVANESLMERDCLEDTFEALLSGLIHYIFGGAA